MSRLLHRAPLLVVALAAAGCAGSLGSEGTSSEAVLLVAAPPARGKPDPPAPESGTDDSTSTPGPEIRGVRLSGKGFTTVHEARGKVVLVHFWATFCYPCKQSLPAWQALQERFRDDLAVIAVSVDEPGTAEPAAIAEFATSAGARFPVVWDRRGETARAFAPDTLPMTFLIDRGGRIRLVQRGFTEDAAEDAAARIAEIAREPIRAE